MNELFIKVLDEVWIEKLIDATKASLEKERVCNITSDLILANINVENVMIDVDVIDKNFLLVLTYEKLVDDLLIWAVENDNQEKMLKQQFSQLVERYQLCDYLSQNLEHFNSIKLCSFDSKFIYKVKLLKSILVNKGIIKEQTVTNMFDV